MLKTLDTITERKRDSFLLDALKEVNVLANNVNDPQGRLISRRQNDEVVIGSLVEEKLGQFRLFPRIVQDLIYRSVSLGGGINSGMIERITARVIYDVPQKNNRKIGELGARVREVAAVPLLTKSEIRKQMYLAALGKPHAITIEGLASSLGATVVYLRTKDVEGKSRESNRMIVDGLTFDARVVVQELWESCESLPNTGAVRRGPVRMSGCEWSIDKGILGNTLGRVAPVDIKEPDVRVCIGGDLASVSYGFGSETRDYILAHPEILGYIIHSAPSELRLVEDSIVGAFKDAAIQKNETDRRTL